MRQRQAATFTPSLSASQAVFSAKTASGQDIQSTQAQQSAQPELACRMAQIRLNSGLTPATRGRNKAGAGAPERLLATIGQTAHTVLLRKDGLVLALGYNSVALINSQFKVLSSTSVAYFIDWAMLDAQDGIVVSGENASSVARLQNDGKIDWIHDFADGQIGQLKYRPVAAADGRILFTSAPYGQQWRRHARGYRHPRIRCGCIRRSVGCEQQWQRIVAQHGKPPNHAKDNVIAGAIRNQRTRFSTATASFRTFNTYSKFKSSSHGYRNASSSHPPAPPKARTHQAANARKCY